LNEKLIIQYICNLHCSVPNFVLAPYQLHVSEFGLHSEKVVTIQNNFLRFRNG